MEHNDYQALEHAIAKHTALEHVLTHTRDAVIAAQRKELEKMRRELDRLNYSHRSLIEYVSYEAYPPHYCQKCGSWECGDGDATSSFFKFYCKRDSGRVCWVLEKVFLCMGCFYDIGSWPEGYFKLCTKYKFSYWCEGNNYSSVREFIDDKDFGDANHGHSRIFVLGNESEFYHDFFLNHKPDKMHHIAAYIIQRAFRCGWDYRRAYDDPDDEEDE